jgi:2-C-methyl-D-erythritol 4-phosphate cytidylyltransferase
VPEEKTVSAIVVAGGIGKRMKTTVPKQFLNLQGRPIIVHCLERFETYQAIDEIILVAPADHLERMNTIIKQTGYRKISMVVAGGARRQDSVKNGLHAVSPDTGIVLIHDGVRPFVSQDQIRRLIEQVRLKGAALLAIPVTNTIKKVAGGIVTETLDRRTLWQAQTPQGFDKALLVEAYEAASIQNISATDDASLVERLGHTVHIVQGSTENIKITTAADIAVAERILEANQ